MIVECDLKELGAHTLVCSSAYTDADGERKYLPQYFRFAVTNPLSVRTKARAAGVATTTASAAEKFPLKGPAKRVHPLLWRQVRSLPGGGSLLECSIENATKNALLVESVRFEPSAHQRCTPLPAPPIAAVTARPHPAEGGATASPSHANPLTAIIASLQPLRASGASPLP